jgi:hypothetical protein
MTLISLGKGTEIRKMKLNEKIIRQKENELKQIKKLMSLRDTLGEAMLNEEKYSKEKRFIRDVSLDRKE